MSDDGRVLQQFEDAHAGRIIDGADLVMTIVLRSSSTGLEVSRGGRYQFT